MVIHKIVTGFEEWFGALLCDIDNLSVENIRRETIECDSILSDLCKVINTNVWLYNNFLLNEDALQKQLESISFMYQYYHIMPIFVNCNIEDIKNGLLSLVIYPANCFFIHQVTALTLWKNIFEISYYLEKIYVEKTFLLIEIGLFVPQSHAALERFFSQLRYVKSNLHTSLSLQSLSALLHYRSFLTFISWATCKECHKFLV